MSNHAWSYVQPPPPTPNGGWYTGARFTSDMPWRNLAVTPDVSSMMNDTLLSANPPPGATRHYASSLRPGNNASSVPGIDRYGPSHAMRCARVDEPGNYFPRPPPEFAKYAAWDSS